MLRRIEDWARRRKIAVRLTGIDRNPFAARAAREFGSSNSLIEWATCEAYEYQPQAKIDLVISSLFTHHLSDPEIVAFLRWMERVTARGWFVNDLHRGRTPYYAFKLLARGMCWHRFVRHDGPVSVRRSFSPADWRRYSNEASLPAHAVNIFATWPGRLCVARVK
jgi:trans-aconitate methyltransferase